MLPYFLAVLEVRLALVLRPARPVRALRAVREVRRLLVGPEVPPALPRPADPALHRGRVHPEGQAGPRVQAERLRIAVLRPVPCDPNTKML